MVRRLTATLDCIHPKQYSTEKKKEIKYIALKIQEVRGAEGLWGKGVRSLPKALGRGCAGAGQEAPYLPLFPALPEHIPIALVVGILQAKQTVITQPVVGSVKAQNAGLDGQSLGPL